MIKVQNKVQNGAVKRDPLLKNKDFSLEPLAFPNFKPTTGNTEGCLDMVVKINQGKNVIDLRFLVTIKRVNLLNDLGCPKYFSLV